MVFQTGFKRGSINKSGKISKLYRTDNEIKNFCKIREKINNYS